MCSLVLPPPGPAALCPRLCLVIIAHEEEFSGAGAAGGGGVWLWKVSGPKPFPGPRPSLLEEGDLLRKLSISVSSHCSGQAPAPGERRDSRGRSRGSVQSKCLSSLGPSSQVLSLFAARPLLQGASLPLSLQLETCSRFLPVSGDPPLSSKNPGRQRSNRFS